jgi:peroxiredoxin
MNSFIRAVMMVILFCTMMVPFALGAYQVGDTVSDFTLPDAFGNDVSFSDFNGMAVIINFWTST